MKGDDPAEGKGGVEGLSQENVGQRKETRERRQEVGSTDKGRGLLDRIRIKRLLEGRRWGLKPGEETR